MSRKKTIRKVEKEVLKDLLPVFLIIAVAAVFLLKPGITGLTVADNITNINVSEMFNQTTDQTNLTNLTNQTTNEITNSIINETDQTFIETIIETLPETPPLAESVIEPILATETTKARFAVRDSEDSIVSAMINVKCNGELIKQTTGISLVDVPKGNYDIDVDIQNKHVKKIEFRNVEIDG
ncbi:hypothetical protein KY337_05745, partial [Candidatus Woesearchaeota archaeon]|nr:hypothetical protein [Candidatus Woesearchaeota archaeon]